MKENVARHNNVIDVSTLITNYVVKYFKKLTVVFLVTVNKSDL